MLGPFATTSRLTPIHQMSLAVLSRAACASMSTTSTTTKTTTTTTTARDRVDRYGPIEWAQMEWAQQNADVSLICSVVFYKRSQISSTYTFCRQGLQCKRSSPYIWFDASERWAELHLRQMASAIGHDSSLPKQRRRSSCEICHVALLFHAKFYLDRWNGSYGPQKLKFLPLLWSAFDTVLVYC